MRAARVSSESVPLSRYSVSASSLAVAASSRRASRGPLKSTKPSEMERTLQVIDCAILVISGTDGVQAHTRTLWVQQRSLRLPKGEDRLLGEDGDAPLPLQRFERHDTSIRHRNCNISDNFFRRRKKLVWNCGKTMVYWGKRIDGRGVHMKKLVIGILAHVDAGKTTLSEAMLYRGGALRRLGRVDHRDALEAGEELPAGHQLLHKGVRENAGLQVGLHSRLPADLLQAGGAVPAGAGGDPAGHPRPRGLLRRGECRPSLAARGRRSSRSGGWGRRG